MMSKDQYQSVSVNKVTKETESSVSRHQQQRRVSPVSSPYLDSLASQAAGLASKQPRGGQDGLGDKGEGGALINPEEILCMNTLLSKQLVENLVTLTSEVSLL